jgi:hypothetical protein
MKNKKAYILSIMLITSGVMHGIQESTANLGAAAVGAACAAGSYKIITDAPNKIPTIVLGGVSFLATAFTYCMLHRSTPRGRIKRANILLNDIARHTLARTCYENEHIFFDAVQDVYLTDDLPLISAYNHLIDLIPTVHYAFGLINKASAEVRKDVLLQEECDASLSRANILFSNISQAVKRIRGHKDYLSQLSIYKENLLQEQQTIAQLQMANAQQQTAQAQSGSTFLKWLKFLLGYK